MSQQTPYENDKQILIQFIYSRRLSWYKKSNISREWEFFFHVIFQMQSKNYLVIVINASIN